VGVKPAAILVSIVAASVVGLILAVGKGLGKGRAT
jgi:hypothetical protein